MTEQTSATNTVDTDNTETNTQATKTFTQDEVNALMARTKSQLEKKYASRYEDLGDPDELKAIVQQHRKHQEEQQLKRGEFDKIIQDLASKKDAEIQKRDKIIESFKVETPILEAAAKHRAVNPEQVKALIRNAVRLNQDGEVEVLDEKGGVRYDDSGRPLSVDSFVQTWLQSNPHFVSATPSTTASRSAVSNGATKPLDISKLDMSKPEHRKIYAEHRKAAGLI
jgi:hypothetical protein